MNVIQIDTSFDPQESSDDDSISNKIAITAGDVACVNRSSLRYEWVTICTLTMTVGTVPRSTLNTLTTIRLELVLETLTTQMRESERNPHLDTNSMDILFYLILVCFTIIFFFFMCISFLTTQSSMEILFRVQLHLPNSLPSCRLQNASLNGSHPQIH